MKKSRNPQLFCVLVATALYALCGSLIHYNVFGLKSFGRSLSLDTYTKLSPANEGEDLLDDFLFIDIDEQSLSSLGQWPWPRKIFAEALKNLNLKKALIVNSQDGLDEISPYANTNIFELNDGIIKEHIFNPKDLGIKADGFQNIVGKDPKFTSRKERIVQKELTLQHPQKRTTLYSEYLCYGLA